MSSTFPYKFKIKKGDIEFEYLTTDKTSLARQFQIWVTCASIYAYNKEHTSENERELERQIGAPREVRHETFEQPSYEVEPKPSFEEPVQNETIQQAEVEILPDGVETTQNGESINSLLDKKNKIAEAVEQAGAATEQLDELFNSNPMEELKAETTEFDETPNTKTGDFDSILEKTIASSTYTPEHKKDERFLKILNMKKVSTMLEHLIVTAYYLSEFEKLDKFTLKLINAKLMQNIEQAVDHTVLQEAIDRNLVESLPSLPNIQSSAEYRLTTLGEEVFLNGTSIE